MDKKKIKKVLILLGYDYETMIRINRYLCEKGYNAEVANVHRLFIGCSVIVPEEQYEKALACAIDYCIENDLEDITCVKSPCQKIREIKESKENSL